MPGGLTNAYGTHQHHPVQRDLQIETAATSSSHQNRRQQSTSELNSAVSSALTADTLTTPPHTMYRTLRQDGIEASGSRRTSRAGSPPLRRSSGIPTSPVNTDVPPGSAAGTDDMTGIGTARKVKKGKRK